MAKRTRKSAGNANAKKKKTGSEEQPAAPLGPFEEATKHRSFQITVEGKSLFVNPHLLAEVSPFFNTLCFGGFKEAKDGRAELKDVKYDDFIEMLFVLGADCSKDRQWIKLSNCIPMMHLAQRWAIDYLMMRCTNYIKISFRSTPTSVSFTLELLLVCLEMRVGGEALQTVASRLAAFQPSVLLSHEINRKLINPSLCTAVFVASNNFWLNNNGESHVFFRDDEGRCAITRELCTDDDCDGDEWTFVCRRCYKAVCNSHFDTTCSKNEYGKKMENEESEGLAPLDLRFFSEGSVE